MGPWTKTKASFVKKIKSWLMWLMAQGGTGTGKDDADDAMAKTSPTKSS